MAYETERIYALNGNQLHIRPTVPDELVIDPASHLSVETEDLGPLHVESGLQVADFAVFLRVHDEEAEDAATPMRIGYLVTEFEGDRAEGAYSSAAACSKPTRQNGPQDGLNLCGTSCNKTIFLLGSILS